MSAIKTRQTDADVHAFILSFAATEQKQKDSFELLRIMQELSGCEPKMWGPSIIGFGTYHYKSERSRQEGDWFRVGFSPRKAAISLYVYSGGADQDELLKKFGKFKMGAGCIYVNKLADIDMEVLKQLIMSTLAKLKAKYDLPK